MALYAHAVIEGPDGRYERGDKVPADIPGREELEDAGSLSSEPYVEDDGADSDEE